MDDVHTGAHTLRSSMETWSSRIQGGGCGVLPYELHPWVESQELPMLEFLVRPQPKDGHGVFGGEWKRPRNMFAAAKSFAKRLERED
ncbi:hypothetical protein EJB05_44804, partial [Eragrostis curvula]